MMLIMLRGVSGAGKTTIAHQFKDAIPVSADDYWGEEYKFDINKLSKAHQYCKDKTKQLLEAGHTVVVHNTSTSNKEMQFYEDLTKSMEIPLVSLVVENRHGGTSVHNVPEKTLCQQEARLYHSIKLR
ncbi:MAG: AAA family ATPase [Phocaeicola sp.]